jgi:hypothetical protein
MGVVAVSPTDNVAEWSVVEPYVVIVRDSGNGDTR